jgi:opacity protein-like surface antigen/outer membrane receptor protein involved in Fe transport
VTAPAAPAAPAPRAPAAPARTAQPSAPTPGAESPTARFDAERNNIFAPLGTAPTTLSREAIEALPQGTNTPFSQVLLQLPGVSQDSAASGNLHVRNEHANVSYRINGILLPDGLGAFGQFLDTSFVGSLTLITGALPAQYGLRTAGIVDITTATFDNVGQVGVYGGSRQTGNYSMQYGGKTGSTEYFFSGRYLENVLGIENPRPSLNAIHDFSQQDRGFAYVSTVIDPTTRLSFIGGITTNAFQIPNTPGVPPSFTAFGNAYFDSSKLNEVQNERYGFGVLALQKSVADVDLQLSYFNRTSSIAFTPDLIGDLMFNGVATNVYRGSVVNGIQGDGAFRLNDAHTLRAGAYVSVEKTTVSGNSQLLPLDATTGAQISDIPFQAIDTSALLGWLGSVYVQDEWRLTDRLTLNTGARFDQMWQYQNANQLSPRVSLTYKPYDSTTFHAGYARYFTPPVQVIAAPTNTGLFTSCPGIPNCTTIQAPSVPPPYYPMLPERANVYDVGVVQKVLPGFEVGVDAYLKTARDLIDDGQFGAALVLDGFNYDRAINAGVELKGVYRNGNFQAYANWAWANQRANLRVSNQFLFDPAGNAFTANNWIYTDHTQIWTGSGGVSYLWYGTRLSADLIYGSGLRSGFENTDHNAPYAQVNTGISHEYFIPGWNPITLRFDIINLFDVSYAIRNGTGVGVFAPQYGPRRGFYFGLAQKFGPGANKPATPAPVYTWLASPYAVWTWTGFYLGGNFGYSISRFGNDTTYSDATLGAPLAAESSYTKHYDALGGGQVGYNWQLGIWVAGIETDMQFAHQRTTTISGCDGAVCNAAVTAFDAPVTLIHQYNLDWFGTVRGRLGAAVTPDLLAYATGGLVYGEVEHLGVIYGTGLDAFGNPTFAGGTFADRQLRAGWAAGGGIEARLTGNVTGRIEYLHADFGADSALASSPLNATPINIGFHSRITEDMVRLGINYKFDPYAVLVYNSAAISAAQLRERPRMVSNAPVAALWTWTGFYFGANAGYAAGRLTADTLVSDATLGTPLLALNSSSTLKGGSGGVQTGYNWQAGMWLTGLETDAQFSTQHIVGSALCPGAVCNPGLAAMGIDAPVTLAVRHSLDWFGTVRGRFGAVFTPDVVAYVTGGLAVGGIAHSADNSGFSLDNNGNPQAAPIPFVTRTAKLGWTVGGGIEARIVGNVTGKIEYLHMDFGDDSAGTLNNQNMLPIAVTINSRLTDDVVRLGINYKFDPNAQAPTPVRTAVPDRLPTLVKGPLIAAPWTWTGYYLGLNSGYSWGRSPTEVFFNDPTIAGVAFATNQSFAINGKVFGIQTGYNLQVGRWLFGMEADAQLTAQHANPQFVCPGTICNPAGPVVANFDQSQKVEWFSTLRARFGAAVTPDLIAYATGGALVAGLQTSGTVFGYDPTGAPTINPFGTVTLNAGWTVGGGVEAHLIGNVTGKIEYLYMNLGGMTTNINNPQVMTLTATFNSRVTDQVVRAGVNYKFD